MAAARVTSSAVAVLLFAAAAAVVFAAHAADQAAGEKDDDLVLRACTNATRYFCRLQLTRDTCVSTLRSDKRVDNATRLSDLTLVALDLVGTSVVAADAAVGAAAANGGDADTARSLQYCRVDYDDMARTLLECRRLLKHYEIVHSWDKNNDSDTIAYLGCADRLRDAAMGCWDQVRGIEEVKKVIGKEVHEVVQRATVAKAIQETMLGMVNPFESGAYQQQY